MTYHVRCWLHRDTLNINLHPSFHCIFGTFFILMPGFVWSLSMNIATATHLRLTAIKMCVGRCRRLFYPIIWSVLCNDIIPYTKVTLILLILKVKTYVGIIVQINIDKTTCSYNSMIDRLCDRIAILYVYIHYMEIIDNRCTIISHITCTDSDTCLKLVLSVQVVTKHIVCLWLDGSTGRGSIKGTFWLSAMTSDDDVSVKVLHVAWQQQQQQCFSG